MRHQHARGRPATWTDHRRPVEISADPIASARTLAELLPDAIDQAESAGLSIIAQYLAKALHLASGIVASDENPRQFGRREDLRGVAAPILASRAGLVTRGEQTGFERA